MVGMATHKVSCPLTKDKVTSFLRAPFTRFQGANGHGEVEEQPRGTGSLWASSWSAPTASGSGSPPVP